MNRDQRGSQDSQGEETNTRRRPGWLTLIGILTWGVVQAGARSVLRWLGDAPQPRRRELEPSIGEEGRDKDRDLTVEPERELGRRRVWGTFLAGCSFAASFAGGVGFVDAYWTRGTNQALGGWLALFMLGWGVAFVLWAHWLTAHKEAVEPRPEMTPPRQERDAALKDFCGRNLERRGLLKWLSACGLGIFAVLFCSLFRSFGFNPGNKLFAVVWERGQRLMKEDGTPVRADSLAPGTTAIVFPENAIGSESAQTVLIRVEEQLLQLPGNRADWAPDGYLAYSRVCTHAGCAVGMYETTTHLLVCPCHQSTFDVLRAAEPTGGPAARPLAQLPLYVDNEGLLRAAGRFSELPGPEFWGISS